MHLFFLAHLSSFPLSLWQPYYVKTGRQHCFPGVAQVNGKQGLENDYPSQSDPRLSASWGGVKARPWWETELAEVATNTDQTWTPSVLASPVFSHSINFSDM